jgi:tRNA threonylcarbamoyladenosine dehydratase
MSALARDQRLAECTLIRGATGQLGVLSSCGPTELAARPVNARLLHASIREAMQPARQAAAALRIVSAEFYAAFTARNRGLLSSRDQQILRRSAFLVAGCGSVGGAVVEPLVRLGAERLMLAEPDSYELHNLNRQHARLGDLGRNKAVVLAEWAAQVNPFARVEVDTAGITAANVTRHVGAAALVFDAVDVTTAPALACKYLLHQQARLAGVPVICGYDIAGVQLVLAYDYRRPRTRVLGGRVAERDLSDPLWFLARVVPLRALPAEIFPELRRQQSGQAAFFPQLAYSALLFGALAPRVAVDMLAGRPVRRRILVDSHDLPRTPGARMRAGWARAAGVARLAPAVLAYRRPDPAPARDGLEDMP